MENLSRTKKKKEKEERLDKKEFFDGVALAWYVKLPTILAIQIEFFFWALWFLCSFINAVLDILRGLRDNRSLSSTSQMPIIGGWLYPIYRWEFIYSHHQIVNIDVHNLRSVWFKWNNGYWYSCFRLSAPRKNFNQSPSSVDIFHSHSDSIKNNFNKTSLLLIYLIKKQNSGIREGTKWS